MKKTDGRKYTNKALSKEIDLWIRFKESGKPVLIGAAVTDSSKGYYGDKYNIFYAPCDYDIDNPFLCVHELSGILEYSVRSNSLKQAKRRLKEYHSSVKFMKIENKTKGE